MVSLGFRGKAAQKSNKSEIVHPQLYLPDLVREYAYVFPTTEDVYNVTARFDSPVPNHTEDDVTRWLRYLRRNFPEAGRSRLVDFGELIINMASAPGPLADGELRKTRELVRWYGKRLWTYWRYAMNLRWPVLWKTSGKVEMLPKGKVPRTFVFMDKLMAICFMRATADFNDKIKLDRFTTRSALGVSIYGPEFIDMANRLASSGRVFTCDVSKWDANMPQAMFKAIALFRQESMLDEIGKDWIAYKYESMQAPLVFMPTGELVRLSHGNMSGQDSTSTDNTLGHACLVEEALERTVARGFPANNYIKLYGDDFVGAVDEGSADAFAEELRNVYILHGFVVKEGAFKMYGGLHGAEFLGGRFEKCKKHGLWTYVPSPRKLVESAHFSDRQLTDEQLLGKIHSLYILAFHTSWREYFRRLYIDARKVVKNPPEYWDEVVIENFVHGLEGSRGFGEIEDLITGKEVGF